MTIDHEDKWRFIKDNIVTLITVATGIGAILLRQLQIITVENLAVVGLGILTLLATTELVDKTRRLDRIEAELKREFARINQAAGDIRVYSFANATSAFDFMAEKIKSAEVSIEHAALAPSVPRWSGEHRRYEAAISTVLKESRIRYRYLAALPEDNRRRRIQKYLSDPSVKQYFVRNFTAQSGDLHFHNFMIFDSALVVVNYPYTEGDPERFLAIENSEVVAFYIYFYNHIWGRASRFSSRTASSGGV
ncbi:hypothetical protein [Actinomadura sp. 7K534]|uniref:hypothetical protein n=1 Tax=Actinomadura sp. 7K534 TaxID=2530366 RepID=UPI0010E63D59|nr:hypothetical protein [Actinomadura sp. 7K534]TDB93625.1 hypothetical protein E1266_19640 [Actinomadura sp. 7K534]